MRWKTSVGEARLVLVLHLIGCDKGAKILKSINKRSSVKQNQIIECGHKRRNARMNN